MPINPFWAGNPASIGQQTMAGQIIVAGANRGMNGTRRKRKASRKTAARRPARSAAKRRAPKRRRMVKGSAAAKAYMAKIRRKRRK